MPSMNGAKFCWSFQQTRLPVVRSRCRKTLPGQEIGALVLIVALRALGEESIAVAPLSSSKRYDATSPAPWAPPASVVTSAALSARP